SAGATDSAATCSIGVTAREAPPTGPDRRRHAPGNHRALAHEISGILLAIRRDGSVTGGRADSRVRTVVPYRECHGGRADSRAGTVCPPRVWRCAPSRWSCERGLLARHPRAEPREGLL